MKFDMKLYNKRLVPFSFFTALVGTTTGATLNIMHYAASDVLLGTGLVAAFIFFVASLYEINSSTQISHRQKMKWTTGFLLFGTLAAPLYMLIGRRRVVGNA